MKKFDNYKIIIKLAWRSVWKNKRRTTLTLLTVMVGCAMIIFTNAIATGSHDKMIEDAVAANVGHIQIHERDFWQNRTIEYAFEDKDELYQDLKNLNKENLFCKRVHAAGLLSLKDLTSGVLIQAINPEEEKQVTSMHIKIIKGRYLNSADKKSIIIGDTLAKNLEAEVGNVVSMISQGFDGSIAAENLTIVGIYKSGNLEYDRTLMIMPIEQAKETFTMMGYINSIVVRAKNSAEIEKTYLGLKNIIIQQEDNLIKNKIKQYNEENNITIELLIEVINELKYIPGLNEIKEIKDITDIANVDEIKSAGKVVQLQNVKKILDSIDEKKLNSINYSVKIVRSIFEAYIGSDTIFYEVMDWAGLMPELVQYIVMDDVGAYIFDLVLFIVVAFGILNTIQMSVFERTREFGIMLAIGTQPAQVKWMVIVESVFITIFGIISGLILGSIICYYMKINPMDFSAYANEMAIWGISTTIFPTELTWLNIVVTSGLIFILSIIFTYFPARRAAKLKPIKAIKQL